MTQNETEQRILDVLKAQGALSGAQIGEQSGLLTCQLYPALSQLEESGSITSDWDVPTPHADGTPRRRIYSLSTTQS